MDNLEKAFGATQALRDASFGLLGGEVHALVGENGSGKSTLVKVLSGVCAPDAGTIEIGGRRADLPTPRAAHAQGIATVFQEVLVAGDRSVLDNVWLGIDDTWHTTLREQERRALAEEALEDLLGRPLDLTTPVDELPLSDRQSCCIVRALLRHPRILILDEATSALDVVTRDRLFAIVDRLRNQGVAAVFITHRMDEIREIGDRITVMRSGHTVGTLERDQWSPPQLIHLMTGSDALGSQVRGSTGQSQLRRGAAVLSVRGLELIPGRRPIDVEVKAGELVGVAGLEGQGGNEFLEALCGRRATVGEVVRHINGQEVVIRSPAQAADNEIAYVPRDRRLDSLFSWMTARENFALPTLYEDTHLGWLSPSSSRRRFASYVNRLGIVLGSMDHAIATLSGGNQQKVVLARWLASGPRILLLNDPTRGIDIGAKRDLYSLLAALVGDGLAVVMLSTELDEHVEIMDRVLVFRRNELFREICRSGLSRKALVAAFFGEDEADDGADLNPSG